MVRKEVVITLNDRGRDLRFKIREMSATQKESWLIRASLLLARGVGSADFDMSDLQGLKDLVVSGKIIKALGGMNYREAAPLLEDLLKCCSRVLDGGGETECSSEVVDGYIEDVRTLFKLRVEAGKHCFGFFTEETAEKLSNSQPSEVIKILRTNSES